MRVTPEVTTAGDGRKRWHPPDGSFDLVVSRLTLIGTNDVDHAIPEMARVLQPGGALLIANVASHASATTGWLPDAKSAARFSLDNYLKERTLLVE